MQTFYAGIKLSVLSILNILFTINLYLASTPILIQPPTNQTALDGKDATIPCTADGSPAPNITWFFNGKKIISQSIKILPYCTFINQNYFSMTDAFSTQTLSNLAR